MTRCPRCGRPFSVVDHEFRELPGICRTTTLREDRRLPDPEYEMVALVACEMGLHWFRAVGRCQVVRALENGAVVPDDLAILKVEELPMGGFGWANT